jgi:uncharacterized protein (DUF2249 family)
MGEVRVTSPILSTTRVSDALAARPHLRQVLPAFHPAFAKLNHPVLGRILPKLVTVAEAARVAGVDVEALVAVMNLPPGVEPPVAASVPRPAPGPAPSWVGAGAVELDVGPAIAAGEEPLPVILAALRGLPHGAALTVIAPFEPVPLIGLLGRQGWDHYVLWDGDRCRVSFHHAGAAGTAALEREVALAERLERSESGCRLDVRDLAPPEPMRLVLAAIDEGALPLTVVHHREPLLLYPHLRDRRLGWDVRAEGDHWEITIRGDCAP